MKRSIFLLRLQRFVALSLSVVFGIMCLVLRDEIGVPKNPPVTAIILGLSILIVFVQIIVDSILSMQIEDLKSSLELEDKFKDEENE